MKLEIRPEGHENEVIKRIARKKERERETEREGSMFLCFKPLLYQTFQRNAIFSA